MALMGRLLAWVLVPASVEAMVLEGTVSPVAEVEKILDCRCLPWVWLSF